MCPSNCLFSTDVLWHLLLLYLKTLAESKTNSSVVAVEGLADPLDLVGLVD